jgi:hypothetical protein
VKQTVLKKVLNFALVKITKKWVPTDLKLIWWNLYQ